MRSSCLFWDGVSGRFSIQAVINHWMWATGQQGFFLPLFSFAGLITAFRRKYSSNSIPLHPFFFFFFPRNVLLAQFRPFRFVFFSYGFHFCFLVLMDLVHLLIEFSAKQEPESSIVSFSTAHWIMIFSKVMAFHCCSTCLARHYAVNMWVSRH